MINSAYYCSVIKNKVIMGLRKNISELESLILKFGYWSKEVRDFNDSLSGVNGFDYMNSINLIVKGKMQDNGTFKKHI